MDVPFSLFELKIAIAGTKETSTVEDEICYSMIEYLSEEASQGILKLYNKVWITGMLPSSWKHSIVIPIKKSGKDQSEVTSYRPTELTSIMCKIMGENGD